MHPTLGVRSRMDGPPNVRRARSPFNRDDADIVLRSSDDVDYQLHKQILSVASPFFKDMFSLQQPPINDKEPFVILEGRHVPVIQVSEISSTLDSLFRILYPTEWCRADLTSLGDALSAAKKYQLQYPEKLLYQSILTSLEKAPLTIYAVACSLGMEQVAALAARSAVGKNVLTESSHAELPFHASMRGRVSAGQYYRLLQYGASPTPISSFVLPPMAQDANVCDHRRSSESICVSLPDLQKGGEVTTHTVVLAPSISERIPPDIIIRAVDGTNLKSHKSILCMVSPTLAKMLCNPLDTIDGLPYIQLNYKSEDLVRVFTLCYPTSPPDITNLDDLTSVVDLAKKYEMDYVIELAKDRFTRMEECTSNPLRAFCIAVYYEWREQAQKLGDVFAKLPLGDSSGYCQEMERIPAYPYRSLLVYHHKCSKALQRYNPAASLNLLTLQVEIADTLLSIETFDPGF